jgi:hypothetical protein
MKDFVDTLNEEQKKALLEALTSKPIETNVQPEPTEEDFLNKNTVGIEEFTMKRGDSNLDNNKRRQSVRAGKNTWSDEGEDRHIETPNATRTPRNRKPPRMKDVVCHSCGKKERINATIAYGDYYRCSRCVGR